jgi:RimJ/RimL family protein N-acetyltransferase
MNIQRIRDSMSRRGVSVTIGELAYRAANRVADARILCALKLTPATLDPTFLEGSAGMTWSFFDEAELERALGQGAEADMDLEFVHAAFAKGDRCYGALDGEGDRARIASYGWYSTLPTIFTDGLVLRFDDDWTYMYKGYTLPAYRGRRLHGRSMARALCVYVDEGKKGFVSLVDTTNEASLRSCRRIGYQDIAHLAAAKFAGRWVTYATPSCIPYGLALVEAREAGSPSVVEA